MKIEKLTTAKQLLDKEFGKKGTNSRKKFQEESYAFYLSEILKSRRLELNLTQEELAEKVGKKRPYISRVENGEDVRISNFVQIAIALDLNFDLQPV